MNEKTNNLPNGVMTTVFIGVFLMLFAASYSSSAEVTGEYKLWHQIILTFDGPTVDEADNPSPFLDYRMDVTFTNGGLTVVCPGYFAADGNAAETSQTGGNKWRVHFIPNKLGTWTWVVSFKQGTEIAVAADASGGTAVAPDGETGNFDIGPTDKSAPDFRARGLLRYVNKHHLQFEGDGTYYIKGGADSPENIMNYYEFDGTYDNDGNTGRTDWYSVPNPDGLHHMDPHLKDWNEGDPTWQGVKGKRLIGGLNYLSSKGVNSMYFNAYNTDGGDGRDVWPWLQPEGDKTHYDVSKLAQWEIVFTHMDKKGIALHLLTNEMENDRAMYNGDLGRDRKLYYRELVARFSHHLAIDWNLGEETTRDPYQLKADATFIKSLDPYDHHVSVHNYPETADAKFTPMLGYEHFDGVGQQFSSSDGYEFFSRRDNDEVRDWRERSMAAGHPWIVNVDEDGGYRDGVKPDSKDPAHNLPRKYQLWGAFMAGAGGVEYYWGWIHNEFDSDLSTEDWSSRDIMWDMNKYALDFWYNYIPFWDMDPANDLVSNNDAFGFAQDNLVYVVYLINGGTTSLDLAGAAGNFEVMWFDPRNGGALQAGSVASVQGGGNVALGSAPNEPGQDWAILVRSTERAIVTNDQLDNATGTSSDYRGGKYLAHSDAIQIKGSRITFDLDKTMNVSADLVRMDGRKVGTLFTGRILSGAQLVPIDRSGLAAGLYLLKVRMSADGQADQLVMVPFYQSRSE